MRNTLRVLNMASPCEMPAGVRGLISFHFPRKRKILQAPRRLFHILRRQNISQKPAVGTNPSIKTQIHLFRTPLTPFPKVLYYQDLREFYILKSPKIPLNNPRLNQITLHCSTPGSCISSFRGVLVKKVPPHMILEDHVSQHLLLHQRALFSCACRQIA